ncbi:PHO85 cyclin-9 [Grifola frondosa]|uniref:PHO85 cyclin-9 n=1 Tax=Grifola frondosa TaxID=5627 RepID=A0A1C7LX16_GRIFR|nr:PHO85 cyclin-9 [Grifola frondosa]
MASLVDSSLHSPALMELIEIDMSRTLIEHLVDTVIETVDYAMGRPSSSARGRTLSRHSEHAKFTKFVTDVIYKAEVKVPALLVSLVYIDRAKPHIQIALEQWACERVFLGALILANKYLNDSTLKNVHWALCTGVFGKRDIGRIEREFLDVLDFELGVQEADILAHHDVIMALMHPHRHPQPKFQSAPARSSKRDVSPSRSHWSSDSSDSDMDVDSESSFESVSPPHTPEQHIHAPLPTKHDHIMLTPAPSHLSTESVQAGSHFPARARSSAMQLLRSFPIPHFPSSAPIRQPYHLAAPPASLAMQVRA